MTKQEIAELEKLAPAMPDRIEFEPGKFAVYNDERHCWIYQDKDGSEIIIRQ